jgi:diguanylate cyclase (GGDEF)-like protein
VKKENNVGFLAALIIVVGISISSIFIFFSYRRVITDNSRNIAELSTMNIFSEINNELTKPLYVSLTMANDTFVRNWLISESTNSTQDIVDYLFGIQDKYEYSSVFLISSNSLDYYRYTGYYKTIDPDDEHDVWYYTFINKDVLYELDVDTDEANGTLTIFVNAKIYDVDDQLLGVIGVGVEMDYVQELIQSFETHYDLEAFLINENGLVQSHSNTSMIESRNIFDETKYIPHRDQILLENDQIILINDDTGFIASRFVDELDWHIVVVKESNVLAGFIRDYFASSFIAMCVVVGAVMILINQVVQSHRKKVFDLAIKDHLTLLLNRRGFDLEYRKLAELGDRQAIVFMIDIDNFKRFNDLHGHQFGDDILIRCSQAFVRMIGINGVLSRWGGDEFAGILRGDVSEMIHLLHQIRESIHQDPFFAANQLTISIGYSVVSKDDSMDHVIHLVDKALYRSKEAGGNVITIE